MHSVRYPFRPKSTSSLEPGQFWAVALASGQFVCGRVLQLGGSEVPSKTRAFFGGLQDWIGDTPPTSDSIAGTRMAKVGVMHIKAITEYGGEILGLRPLDLDGIDIPALHSAWGLGGKLLHGADAVRDTREDEWGTRPTLVYWSYGYIEMLGEELAAARF